MPATQAAILPDHVLAAVFALAKQESKKQRLAFRSHDFHLQDIFSELAKKYPILSPFVFSDSGPEPYSPALSESVSRLQLSGLIGRENPDYEVVFLRDAADRFFDHVLKSEFDNDQLQQLGAIASELLRKLELV
jgi:hypothetical protein